MKTIIATALLCLSFSAMSKPSLKPQKVEELLNTLNSVNSPASASLDCPAPAVTDELDEESKKLAEKKWYGGAKDCEAPGAKSPPYEVLQVNAGYYVMRQNKCINFEAPFIYLHIGTQGALLFDTGSTSDAGTMPLRAWVDEILKSVPNGDKLKLTVAHSHSHDDHTAGDEQFAGRPNTTIIGQSPTEVAAAFGIKNWPVGEGTLDLGGKKISILPIPGHEKSSIAVYDHNSGDMLTGDTLYPGNVFLSEDSFSEFKDSMNRLHAFSQKHKVRNYLGAHVEMSAVPKKDYPYGSTYHPNEHKLPLRQEQLDELKTYLDKNPKAVYKEFNDFFLKL